MPAQVNYWLVEEGQLRVCDNSSLISTTQFNNGLAYWNNGLGTTLLVTDTDCTGFGVELIDVNNGDCGYRDPPQNSIPVGACTILPGVDSPQVLVDDINLDFINFNPNFMALQLHVRNGNTAGSPLVMSSACVIYYEIGAVGPMPASSFSSGNLAVQGHGVESTTTCAPTHANDSSSVGSDVIPTKAGFCCTTPVPPGVGGIAQVPSIDGPDDGAGTWALGVAAAAVALLLAAGALYAWRR